MRVEGDWDRIISFLFFPLFFQDKLLSYLWFGADSPDWVVCLQRIFLVLPGIAFVAVCWLTIASILTILIRQNRRQFASAIFIGWWDLGRSTLLFWGGMFKFLWLLANTMWSVVRLFAFAVWTFIKDVFLLPFTIVRSVGDSMLAPGVPWIAVGLTFIWCLIEATIFTFVTSQLVIETLSNITGTELSEEFVRIPLFLFMLFLILGSYAVLSSWNQALKSRNIPSILKISLIELVAMMVEVVFLYREFVDSLVPWFAQHSSGDFQPGIAGILIIAGLTWLGIRGMSWFLFAAAGTPMILSVIQGTGVKVPPRSGGGMKSPLIGTATLLQSIRSDADWFSKKGEELLDAFLLPPLQLLAVITNFAILLLIARPLFPLPLKSVREIVDSKQLLNSIRVDDKG